jgi:DNA-binding MarR family transcriptional regulator
MVLIKLQLPLWITAIQPAMTEMRDTRKPRSARRLGLTDGIRHGNVELRHLRYFVVAAEELNLRRAADRLEITQPALTKQVSGLEEQIGVSLFARQRHRLAGLTAAGTEFLAEARQILDQVEDAIRGVQLVAHGRSGRLRIGLTDDAATLALTSILAAFHAGSPNVLVKLVELSDRKCFRRLKLTQSISYSPRSRGTPMGSSLKSYGGKTGASCFLNDTHSVVRTRSSRLTWLAKPSLWSVLRPRRQCSPGCAGLVRSRIGLA